MRPSAGHTSKMTAIMAAPASNAAPGRRAGGTGPRRRSRRSSEISISIFRRRWSVAEIVKSEGLRRCRRSPDAMPAMRLPGYAPRSAELAHRHRGVGHAVGKAPFVVVPGQHAHEPALDHLSLLQVEGRARRVVVEVGADQRLVVGLEDALQALARGGNDRL